MEPERIVGKWEKFYTDVSDGWSGIVVSIFKILVD